MGTLDIHWASVICHWAFFSIDLCLSFRCAHPRTKAPPPSTSLCMLCMIRKEMSSKPKEVCPRTAGEARTPMECAGRAAAATALCASRKTAPLSIDVATCHAQRSLPTPTGLRPKAPGWFAPANLPGVTDSKTKSFCRPRRRESHEHLNVPAPSPTRNLKLVIRHFRKPGPYRRTGAPVSKRA
jgi:hypothetical protein